MRNQINNAMDRRQSTRVTAYFPVKIWGLDANGLPFSQLARVKNISSGGALLQGVQQQMRPGEVLDVQFGGQKAQFRVAWAGKPGDRQGEIGLECLPSEPYLWDIELDRCIQMSGELAVAGVTC